MAKNFFLILIIGLVLNLPAHAADVAVEDVASTSYFPVLPFDASPDSNPEFLPIVSNHELDGDHTGLTQAIIAIHDFTRDAQNTLATLSSLAGSRNGTALIIAPQFLLDFDVARLASRLPDQGRMFVRWPLDGWQNGGDSLATPPAKPISAFTVIDLMVLYLSDKKTFPDMKQITIVGHGAGGDFVQRYAASGRAASVMGADSPQLRFLVANASSYLYMTGLRPRAGKGGFTTPDAATCPAFNGYPYGVDKLNDYVRRVGATAIKLSYASRNITYLIGEKTSTSDPLPDNSCAAMLQGTDRNIRANYYNAYLNLAFGEGINKHQKFLTVPKASYNPAALFGSPCGLAVLFGNGLCAP